MNSTESSSAGVFENLGSEGPMTSEPTVDSLYESLLDDNDSLLAPSLAAQVTNALHIYARPALLFTGILGNLLSLILMQRPFLKKSSASVYFSTLAVADNCYLLCYSLTEWMSFALKEAPWLRNDFACKLLDAIVYVALCTSGWTVLALTVERTIVVIRPLQAKTICTRRNALITVTCISLVFICLWAGIHFGWGVSFKGECDNGAVSSFLYVEGWVWMALALDSFIPLPLLAISNGVLIYGLINATKQRTQISQAAAHPTQATNIINKTVISAFTVSILHLLLTTPISASFVLADTVEHTDGWLLLVEVTFILRIVNHSANFFLYLVTLPKMRAALLDILTCGMRGSKKGQKAPANNTSGANTKSA